MIGGTEIFVSGRQYKVPGDLVTYDEIVKIWNELHAQETKIYRRHSGNRL